MNRNLKLFMIAESVFVTGFGLIFPIFSVFINEHLQGGSVLTAGIAITIYQLGKSLLRIPISKYCDKHKLHKQFMITGYYMMALVPFFYFFITSIYHLFLVEFYFALAAAMGRSGWYAILTRSLHKGKEGSTWSSIKAYTGIGNSIAATIGGLLVTLYGFDVTFIIIGILAIIASTILTKVEI